ncbi:threonine--tRNA ligase [Thermogladius sp. KZ2Tp1]|uniref:threonine--tRNA ligase n=1 Tax=Thermogladius sp. KZ2Tp1 TaxID=3136289 RepID=UPI003DA7BC75
MRLLLIHAKRFSYKVREPAVKEPESLGEASATGDFENALVVFSTVEQGDDESVAERAASEIYETASSLKPGIVVVYPYAHLSSELAPPPVAMDVLRKFADKLKERGLRVERAPFGWYKEFALECYGHPLSELSKTIRKQETGVVRRTVEKTFYIVTPEGRVYNPTEFDYSKYPDLKILVDKEVFGVELAGGENRVNDYCRKFGFEWEPMSDHGHMRYGPHAVVIMESVMRYSWQVVRSLGIPVFKVMGSNMFNLKERPVLEHALLFGDRLYEVAVDEDRYVMRYAACHQQFAMLRDWVISHKDLPFGMFEVADSYRLEQRGELNLCFRLRKFYMPDLHILTRDLREAIEVSKLVQEKIMEEARKVGRRYVALYNVSRDFFENNFNDIVEYVKRENYPVLVAVIPGGIYYWVLNVEYHIIDNIGRPREIATFQIDVGNGKRFNITYTTPEGEKRHPVIIHTAIIGGVERYIYMLLDTAALEEKQGRTPSIPTWLAPVQVRVVPVSKDYVDYAVKVAQALAGEGYRVDVDDRDESLGKKIRDAGREWVPYIVVVGEREVKSGTLSVRVRATNETTTMSVSELTAKLGEEVKGYPRTEPTLPLLVSRRPLASYQL